MAKYSHHMIITFAENNKLFSNKMFCSSH